MITLYGYGKNTVDHQKIVAVPARIKQVRTSENSVRRIVVVRLNSSVGLDFWSLM